MKMRIALLTVVTSALFLSAVAEAAYLIHLRNGGQFLTGLYWEEGSTVKFYTNDGMMGVEKSAVWKIEKTRDHVVYGDSTDDGTDAGTPEHALPQAKPPGETEKHETAETAVKAGEAKADIQEYRDKKAQLKVELDEWVEKMRDATRLKDSAAKEKARIEMRKVAAQIYNLTDEVKAKNKGKLPEGWWD
jgi:hypothetical protein